MDSGDPITRSHSWGQGMYVIWVTARDIYWELGGPTPVVIAVQVPNIKHEIEQVLALDIFPWEKILDGKLVKEMGAVEDSLADSLDGKSWVDDSTLDRKEGEKVFLEHEQAVKTLDRLARDGDAPEALPVACEDAMARIAMVDVLLAKAALEDAQQHGMRGKGNREHKIAEAELDEAMGWLADGDWENVVDHCLRSWKASQKAMR